jgi:predicted nucleic acid-binding Zn ribbon protein/DNA-binding CsgD family transcriptional regulator
MAEAEGCSDHPCDNCARCLRGQCCRYDRPLPALGDWEGQIYGELGVLAADEDGQQVQCHVCGGSFRSVGVHAVQAHQLSAREYKAIFGLRLGTALVAPESRARLQARPIDHLRPYWERAAENIRSLTPERRNTERHWALEARRDPANRARWQALSQRYAPEAQKRVQMLRQDPQWAAEWRRRYRQGRGQLGRTPRPCIVCGTAFPSQTGRRTCSDVCEAAARSRTARGREVSSEMRERLRVAREAQRRADPAWQERAALLRQLPTDLFDALPEAQRVAVRGFYGLDTYDGQPLPTLEALAPRCGVGHAATVRALVRRATASLLGLALADPTRRAVARCSVCDQPILRPQASQAHACSPACMAELRRRARARQYRRELEAREPRRRALLELPPEGIASLQERERTILQLFYGLEGQEPRSQYAIAAQLGLRQYLVSYVVRTVTARLLGWRVLDPTGQLQVLCTILLSTEPDRRPTSSTPAVLRAKLN